MQIDPESAQRKMARTFAPVERRTLTKILGLDCLIPEVSIALLTGIPGGRVIRLDSKNLKCRLHCYIHIDTASDVGDAPTVEATDRCSLSGKGRQDSRD